MRHHLRPRAGKEAPHHARCSREVVARLDFRCHPFGQQLALLDLHQRLHGQATRRRLVDDGALAQAQQQFREPVGQLGPGRLQGLHHVAHLAGVLGKAGVLFAGVGQPALGDDVQQAPRGVVPVGKKAWFGARELQQRGLEALHQIAHRLQQAGVFGNAPQQQGDHLARQGAHHGIARAGRALVAHALAAGVEVAIEQAVQVVQGEQRIGAHERGHGHAVAVPRRQAAGGPRRPVLHHLETGRLHAPAVELRGQVDIRLLQGLAQRQRADAQPARTNRIVQVQAAQRPYQGTDNDVGAERVLHVATHHVQALCAAEAGVEGHELFIRGHLDHLLHPGHLHGFLDLVVVHELQVVEAQAVEAAPAGRWGGGEEIGGRTVLQRFGQHGQKALAHQFAVRFEHLARLTEALLLEQAGGGGFTLLQQLVQRAEPARHPVARQHERFPQTGVVRGFGTGIHRLERRLDTGRASGTCGRLWAAGPDAKPR